MSMRSMGTTIAHSVGLQVRFTNLRYLLLFNKFGKFGKAKLVALH